MASEIKYTFYTHVKEAKGLMKGGCNGKKTVYDGFINRIECYSHNYNQFKLIAVFRLKSWKEKSERNTLINDAQSIAA